MDSIGYSHMKEVLENQLFLAEEAGDSVAIMCVKVIMDEFEKTYGHLG